jgi:hypothetical protein
MFDALTAEELSRLLDKLFGAMDSYQMAITDIHAEMKGMPAHRVWTYTGIPVKRAYLQDRMDSMEESLEEVEAIARTMPTFEYQEEQ